MSFLTKIVDSAGGGGPVGLMTGVLTQCEAVTEFLSSSVYPDGTARERSVLSVFIEDGRVKVCLNDRDTSRTLWRSASGIEDAVVALELAITDGTADWRRAAGTWKGAAARKGK